MPSVIRLALGTVLCGLFVLLCLLYSGPLPQMVFGHDLFVLLDGAWKWQHGIVSHADYYSPLGPFTFWLISVSTTLTGSIKTALPMAVSIGGLFTLLTASYAAFSRLSRLPAIAAVVLLFGAAIAPAMLKFPTEAWTYACIYNRWGYALIGVLFLVACLPARSKARHLNYLDGALAAFCLVSLFFLKISYGAVAFAAFCGLSFLVPRSRRYFGAFAAAAALCVLFWGLQLRWEFGAMFRDIDMARNARSGLDLTNFLQTTREMWLQLILCLAATIAACVAIRTRESASWFSPSVLMTGAIFGGIIFSALLITLTNSPLGDRMENPLLGLTALLALHLALAARHNPKPTAAPSNLALLLFAGLACVVTLFPTVIGNYTGVVRLVAYSWRGDGLSVAETIPAGPLAGIQIRGLGGEPPLPTTYVGKIMDGVSLLAATHNLNRPVLALDFSNPFNSIQGTRPPSGSPLFWHLGFSYQETTAPTANRVFAGAEIVLVPKTFGDGNPYNLQVLEKLYGDWIAGRFTFAGESSQWRAYSLKPDVMQTSSPSR